MDKYKKNAKIISIFCVLLLLTVFFLACRNTTQTDMPPVDSSGTSTVPSLSPNPPLTNEQWQAIQRKTNEAFLPTNTDANYIVNLNASINIPVFQQIMGSLNITTLTAILTLAGMLPEDIAELQPILEMLFLVLRPEINAPAVLLENNRTVGKIAIISNSVTDAVLSGEISEQTAYITIEEHNEARELFVYRQDKERSGQYYYLYGVNFEYFRQRNFANVPNEFQAALSTYLAMALGTTPNEIEELPTEYIPLEYLEQQENRLLLGSVHHALANDIIASTLSNIFTLIDWVVDAGILNPNQTEVFEFMLNFIGSFYIRDAYFVINETHIRKVQFTLATSIATGELLEMFLGELSSEELEAINLILALLNIPTMLPISFSLSVDLAFGISTVDIPLRENVFCDHNGV